MIAGSRWSPASAFVLAAGLGLAPVPAMACSIIPPSVEVTVQHIAQHGVVMGATVIQALDEEKGHAEIIRADVIYAGDGDPREFVIYASMSANHPARERPVIRTSCDWVPISHPVGHVYDLVVLEPFGGSDAGGNGRWVFSLFGNPVTFGEGLRHLIDEADRNGRFRSRPEVPEN